MQLVIDIGNTRIKAALFEENNLLHGFVFKNTEEIFEQQILQKYAVENCIVCSVVNDIAIFLEKLNRLAPVLVYTSTTPIPLTNKYESPDTLGADRLAVAVAGNYLFPDKSVLVIDTGTCIKYNFINSKNEFIGGGISPGLEMRFKALNTFTARLPLLSKDPSYKKLIGCNSTENILSGVELGAIAEINSFIDQYKAQFSDIQILLAGGDMIFFEKRLKKPIFADPYLTLKGLNIILNHNLKTEGFSAPYEHKKT